MDGKKEMLRKKCHVVRKKNHVVRKLFYVASIFDGVASRKNGPPWELSSTAWEVSSTAGELFPTASRRMRLPNTCLFEGRSNKFTGHPSFKTSDGSLPSMGGYGRSALLKRRHALPNGAGVARSSTAHCRACRRRALPRPFGCWHRKSPAHCCVPGLWGGA